MQTEPPRSKNPWWSIFRNTVALVAFILVAGQIIPPRDRFRERGNLTKGIMNCRQIITAMRIYSADHDGAYPDVALANPRSSNEVFRILFQKNIIDNELMFGCPLSPYAPDGDLGEAPEYKKALEPGENHWAMIQGLDDRAPGSIPLVYENPAIATWSPKWNLDAKGTNTRGRTWRTGIIIGMNDGSVGLQPLEANSGTEVPLKDLWEGENLFTHHKVPSGTPEWTILDIEVKP